MLLNEVIAVIALSRSNGDRDAVVGGAAVSHVVARGGAVEVGYRIVASRLRFDHDVGAGSEVREAVAAVASRGGRCTHSSAIGRIAIAIRVGEQGNGHAVDADIARVVIVRICEDRAADGRRLFFDEVVAAGGGTSHDIDRADLAWITAIAVAHIQIAGRLGFQHAIGAGRHTREGVAAIGCGCGGDGLHAGCHGVAIHRIATAIDQSKCDTADACVARVVIVRVSEHRATDGAGLLLNEVVARVAFARSDRNWNAVVRGAAIRDIIARGGAVHIGDGVVA